MLEDNPDIRTQNFEHQ